MGTPGRPADREPHLEIADGTYVDDGARPCVIQEAGAEGGAGVGSDQGGSWDSAFYAQRACSLCPGMDIDLHNTQSSEVVAKWKGDFTSGGLVETSGRGRGIRILPKPTIRSLFLSRDMPTPTLRTLLTSRTGRFNPFSKRFEQQAPMCVLAYVADTMSCFFRRNALYVQGILPAGSPALEDGG